jgi:hypothetical protein
VPAASAFHDDRAGHAANITFHAQQIASVVAVYHYTVNMRTEALTIDMIRTLRDEARLAADFETVTTCIRALCDGDTDAAADIAEIITAARAMDESRPFVRVEASK